jgi:hypothetical protein
MTQLWIPGGATYSGVSPLGRNKETGGHIVRHSFILKAKDRFGVEHKTRIEILADDSMSQNQIEEMMGNSAQSFLEEVRKKYTKRRPTAGERKQIGKALNDFRISAAKRRERTNVVRYYQLA